MPSLAIWGSDRSSLGKDGEGTSVPSPCNSHGLKVLPLLSTLGKGKNTARKAGKKTGNSDSTMVTRRGRIDWGGELFQDVDLWDAISPLLISVSADGGHRDHPHLSPPTAARRLERAFLCSFSLTGFLQPQTHNSESQVLMPSLGVPAGIPHPLPH